MLMQSDKFLAGAADDYYQRNKADFGKSDPVLPLLEKVNFVPRNVLEIGCADGWRLRRLQEKYGCGIAGIDPSGQAIEAAIALTNPTRPSPAYAFSVGTADNLSVCPTSHFDLVIVGFCMWFIEPWQWFKVVAESDRVLQDGGALIVHDFSVPYGIRWSGWSDLFGSEREKDTTAWLYDFPRLWLGHPCYSFVEKQMSAKRIGNLFILEAATMLRKSFYHFVRLGEKTNGSGNIAGSN